MKNSHSMFDSFSAPDASARNTLGVDGAQFYRLLERLDEVGNACSKPNPERVFRRLNYANPRVRMFIENEGHTSQDMIVASRNLSQGGISILHANFMYPKSRVRVVLERGDGTVSEHPGRVTRCDHRGGVLHEIGIRFEKEIRLQEYLQPSVDTLMHSRERVKPEELNIRVLFHTSDSDFSALARQFLLPTNLKYKFEDAQTIPQDIIDNQDLIVVHYASDSASGIAQTGRLRCAGYNKPVILIGRPDSSTEAMLVNACGADMSLPWPCDESTLLCAIGEYVYNAWTPETLQTVRACINPEVQQAVELEFAMCGVKLDQATRVRDLDQTRDLCFRISQFASFVDQAIIARAVSAAVERLENEPDAAYEELAEIAQICKTRLKNKAA